MDHDQIHNLIRNLHGEITCTETHISFILITENFAYKFKKPLNLTFLNFESLEARKHFCEEELKLNRRLAPEIYLEVLPVKENHGQLSVDPSAEGKVVDYTVKMEKMNNELEMDRLLERHAVTPQHIDQLAQRVAAFHVEADIVTEEPVLSDYQKIFNGIDEHLEFVEEKIGQEYGEIILRAIRYSDHFLESHFDLIKQRGKAGLIRDVHGDLHSGNIVLDKVPVIFDCIEFDPVIRQIDLLNEIAFLCMDLEIREEYALSQQFYQTYLDALRQQGIEEAQNEALFLYFKIYRASVRAKVNSIDARAHTEDKNFDKKKESVVRYLILMNKYLDEADA